MPDLRYQLTEPAAIGISERRRMHALMAASYHHDSFDRFESDLEGKSHVGLLLDRNNSIQGFSTLALNPGGIDFPDCDVLFSGDTVISPEYWGSQELVRGFCRTAGAILAARNRPLYWLLISKGHRTYLYLPLFFRSYHPCTSAPASDSASADANAQKYLADLADRCCHQLFPEAWNPAKGVLRFPYDNGPLREHLAGRAFAKETGNRHVRFFLERNPEFAAGDELVCITRIQPENMLRQARLYLLEGMREGAQVEMQEGMPSGESRAHG